MLVFTSTRGTRCIGDWVLSPEIATARPINPKVMSSSKNDSLLTFTLYLAVTADVVDAYGTKNPLYKPLMLAGVSPSVMEWTDEDNVVESVSNNEK